MTGLPQISVGCVLAAAALCACGGADHGRPKVEASPPRAEAGVDPDTDCAVAGDLTLQPITLFEPAPGSNPKFKLTGECDPGVSPGNPDCMYYNYDTEQSPGTCSPPTPSLPTCVQANGAPEPASFCMNTNILSPSGMVLTTEIPGMRCGVSAHAFHLATTNIAACYDPVTKKEGWGATLQITFGFDASTWDGVSLWVRRGPASSQNAILVNVQDEYTFGGSCEMVAALEPAVADKPPDPDALKCDPFGLGVGLTDEWRFVKVPFAKTEQKGFGVPSPLGKLDLAGVSGMQLVLNPGDWDVWVDDIAFYREPK